MRIGIDASRAFVDQPTGTERYSREMLMALLDLPEAKDHTFVLFVRLGQKVRFEAESFSNMKVEVIEISLPRLWTQVGLAWKTWTTALDVLWVPAHTLPVFRKPGLKTVVTIHGIEYEWLPAYENPLQRWYLPLSTKYAVATATKIVAVSEFTKSQLVTRLGAAASRIQTIYEGYDPQQFTLDVGILKRFGLEKQKYILFVGTIQPRKNLDRLIEAFANLDMNGVKLVIAGKWGWSYDAIALAPKTYGAEKKVVFTGYISDTERYSLLQFATFYIQPSITEGFGLPILEAWQAGKAVASSSGGALAEVVGQAGELFDPSSVEDMAQAMRKMFDETYVLKLKPLGEKRLKEFSWKKSAKNILELFLSLGR